VPRYSIAVDAIHHTVQVQCRLPVTLTLAGEPASYPVKLQAGFCTLALTQAAYIKLKDIQCSLCLIACHEELTSCLTSQMLRDANATLARKLLLHGWTPMVRFPAMRHLQRYGVPDHLSCKILDRPYPALLMSCYRCPPRPILAHSSLLG